MCDTVWLLSCITPPAFKENAPDISLTAKNKNRKELDEGKTSHYPERQFPTVLSVSVILRAARYAHVIASYLVDSFLPWQAEERDI